MKVIEITSKWAVVADHIVDVWLGGDDSRTFNITYDIPDRQKDSITFDSEDQAKAIFAHVVAQLRGIQSLEDINYVL